MNHVSLTGRLVADPEVSATPSGTPICKIRLAVDRMGRDDAAGYINVTSFGPGAAAAGRHLTKGWLVAVDGRLDYSEWTTEAEQRRSRIEVVGHVEFLAAPKANGDDSPPTPAASDDIPF